MSELFSTIVCGVFEKHGDIFPEESYGREEADKIKADKRSPYIKTLKMKRKCALALLYSEGT